MGCNEFPLLLPRIMELLVREHQLVSHYKYSDLLYYQFDPTKKTFPAGKASVGSDTFTAKLISLLGFNWYNRNARGTHGFCSHRDFYCYNWTGISLPKTLLVVKFRTKQLLALKADTFRKALLNGSNSSTGLEVHISRSKFSNHLLSLFFITQIMPFIIIFLSSFHLAHYKALVWLSRSYATQRERRFQGGTSIPRGFQESPETLTDLI